MLTLLNAAGDEARYTRGREHPATMGGGTAFDSSELLSTAGPNRARVMMGRPA